MSWDYAELSHTAKSNGGPDKYIETIKAFTRQEVNLKWTKAVVPISFLLAPFVLKGVTDLGQYVYKKLDEHTKKSISREEVEAAEKALRKELGTVDAEEQPPEEPC